MPRSDGLPENTSASQLSCYAQCPRKFCYRYVLGADPEYRAPGLALGAALHGTIGWWFEERVAGREVSREQAVRVLQADLAAAVAFDNVRWGSLTRDELFAEATRMLGVALDEIGDEAVREAEVRFDFVIIDPLTGEQMPRPMVGYFDLELEDGRIIELKTTRSSYSDADLRTNLQFAAYRTAMRWFGGYDVELVALVRTKQPKVQRATLPSDPDTARWFLSTAAEIERAIAKGIFPPSPSSSCSSCEYEKRCLGHLARAA